MRNLCACKKNGTQRCELFKEPYLCAGMYEGYIYIVCVCVYKEKSLPYKKTYVVIYLHLFSDR